jgi:hypothetical protein
MRIHRPIEYVSRSYFPSQENPYTTAEGVKIGGISRVTPKVLPEKVSNLSPDTHSRKSFCDRYKEVYCPRCLVDCIRRQA